MLHEAKRPRSSPTSALRALMILTLPGAMSLARFQGTTTNAALAQKATTPLRERCFKCHGAGGAAQNGIFVLDRQKLIAAGALVPGSADSLLLEVVRSQSMPKLAVGEKPLSLADIAGLRDWIVAGAPASSHRRFHPAVFHHQLRNRTLHRERPSRHR
jgi:mono/diheme cytochrome c family protein